MNSNGFYLFFIVKSIVFCIFLFSFNLNAQDEEYATRKIGILRDTILKLPFHSKATKVKIEMIDNKIIFEGDIILGELQDQRARTYGTVIAPSNSAALWPKHEIPFEIIGGHPMTSLIYEGIYYLNRVTNLIIRPKLDQDRTYLLFKLADGNRSRMGMMPYPGAQGIDIDTASSFRSIIHEICHAAGLYHEHTRADRDNYVIINWDNIIPDQQHNYIINPQASNPHGPYDYKSRMHYSLTAFRTDSAKANGRKSMEIVNPEAAAGIRVGVSDSLSIGDIKAINSLYPVYKKPEAYKIKKIEKLKELNKLRIIKPQTDKNSKF